MAVYSKDPIHDGVNEEFDENDRILGKSYEPHNQTNSACAIFFILCCVSLLVIGLFSTYILDLYFSYKILESESPVKTSVWLITNGSVGLYLFILGGVYWIYLINAEGCIKPFVPFFYSIFIIGALFITSWTIVGWICFFRYPTSSETAYDSFHTYMWVRLPVQTVISVGLMTWWLCSKCK